MKKKSFTPKELAMYARMLTSGSLFTLALLGSSYNSNAQNNVGIGTATPNASALLDISSDTKGLLIPRMTGTQRDNISSPATSLIIYQTDGVTGLYINSGTPASPSWTMLHKGTLGIDNGGTGATTAAGARTNLGLGTLATLSSVTSTEITNGTIVDADISSSAAIAGSKISGNISGNAANVTGTVAIANGGTDATTAAGARTNLGLGTLATLSSVTSTEITNGTIVDADISSSAAIAGSKISGNISGNAANVTGTVAIANGGTGATTQAGALNALLPAQAGNTNKVLTTNGTNASWQTPAGGSGGSSPVFDIRTTAASVTSSSPNYVDALSVTLEANKIYQIDGSLILSRSGGANAAVTYRYTYSGTATTDIGVETAGSIVPGTSFSASGSFDNEAAGFGSTASATAGARAFRGYIRTTTAGTLKIQAARTTANTANDFNIREGSYLILRPLN